MSKEQQPVIKKALGNNWDELANIVKQHYDITPGEPSNMIIKGVMDEVYHSVIAKLFILPGRIFGALVPYKGKKIPTEVRNWTTTDNHEAMFWHRTLVFPNKPPVIFKSRMEHIEGDEIIEYVRYGMGIRMRMSVKESALIFKSIGYVWKLGGIKISIPTWAILGDAVIIEKSISDDQFFIDFHITHPLFGRTFAYSGIYSIENTENNSQAYICP
ncbi:MAG: DUF4166 domain-containing protein [Gammaproteobacteria bacterium]|nr:DUF4166 domain-containing protein [Gammaproteobacteria bacterium]